MAINSPLKYASYTMVQARLNSRTPLTQVQIENIIEQCEQYLDTLMKNNGTITFDAAKHQIIRRAVINMAVMLVAGAEPLSLSSLEQFTTQMDIARSSLNSDLDILKEQDFITWLSRL